MLKKFLALGLVLGMFVFVSHQVLAEEAESKIVVDGTVYNADGTPFNTNEQVNIQFIPVQPENPAEPWKDMFGLFTNLSGFTRSTFSSTPFTWLKIKSKQYRATARQYHRVGVGHEFANREIDSESQLVDITNGLSPVHLQFRFKTPNKFITGLIVDELGVPIPGKYDAENRRYDARAEIRVRQTQDSQSEYRDYTIMPDEHGRFSVAVSHQGGYYDIFPHTDFPDKFLRSTGYQASGSFSNDTTKETRDVQLTLTRAGNNTLSGRIVDSKGNPVGSTIVNGKSRQNVAVYADAVTGNIGQYYNVEADGKFSMKLRDGSFRFSVLSIRRGEGDDQRYVNYPTQIVELQNGLSVDLGDIKPQFEIEDNPSSPNAPQVVSVYRNEAIRTQTDALKTGTFVETFADQKYFDSKSSVRVSWNNGVTITPAQSGVAAQATASEAVSGVAVSKKIGPIGTTIRSVTVMDFKKVSGGGSIQYAISVDGKNWKSVAPGKATAIPSGWRTSKGLLWKATMAKNTSTDEVELNSLRVSYSFVPTAKKPTIKNVRVRTTSSRANVVITGENLTDKPIVYVGSTKINLVKVSGNTVAFTVKRDQFRKANYAITVVGPDLQSVVKMNVSLKKNSG